MRRHEHFLSFVAAPALCLRIRWMSCVETEFYTNSTSVLSQHGSSGETFMSLAEIKKIQAIVEKHGSKVRPASIDFFSGQKSRSEWQAEGNMPEEDHDRIRSSVSKTLLNFWLDAFLLVAFVAHCIVSVILQFVFPPGINAKGWLLWGMNHNQWSSVQFGVLSVLSIGILLHLMLHWTWVCSVASRKLFGARQTPDSGLQTIYGVGLLIAILLTSAACIGVATMTIQIPPQ